MNLAKKMLTFTLAATLALGVFGNFKMVAAQTNTNPLPILTVEEAARRAIRYNSGIANAEDDESVADEVVRRSLEAVWDAPTSIARTNALVGLMNAELSRSLNLRDIRAQKENVEFQITRYFNTILNMEADLSLSLDNLEMARRDLLISRLKLSLGMVSELDYETSELAVTRIETNIERLESSIDSAFRDLNSFMGTTGINLDQRHELILVLEYNPLETVNLSGHAERFVSESLMVQRAQNAADLATYHVDNFVTPHDLRTGIIPQGFTTYEERVVDQNRALRNLADTRQRVRESVITSYSNLRDIELSIRAAEIELERLTRQLSVSETMLELGRITPIEVDRLRLEILSTENNLMQTMNNHTILSIAFNSPLILMGQ
ncbi:MAG: TolC family protein [Defluviitaleaceae bacterium]|nr:TolC family protein [Defluviitaleaceae bacterium]